MLLPVVGRNAAGHAQRVGMAHVDDFVSTDALRALFQPLLRSARPEISMIGGSQTVVDRVDSVAEAMGIRVVFRAPNPDGSRVDDAAIDCQGRVFYGLTAFQDSPQFHDICERLYNLERSPGMGLQEQLNIQNLSPA